MINERLNDSSTVKGLMSHFFELKKDERLKTYVSNLYKEYAIIKNIKHGYRHSFN